MKPIQTLLFFFALGIAPMSFGAETISSSNSAHDHPHTHNGDYDGAEKIVGYSDGTSCKDTLDVKVNGLVCDFCARALEKIFGKRSEVAGIEVDLDRGKVTIALKPGETIQEKTLKKLINNSGYNMVSVNRRC